MYGIMTEELVIREIRINDTACRGHFATLTPINYESPIVRYVALSWLVIRENE